MWSGGYTMGSYCGRVRLFLAAAYVDFQRLPGNTTLVAQAPAPQPPPSMTATATAPPRSAENYPAATRSTGCPAGLPRQGLPETPVFPAEGAVPGSPLRPGDKAGPFVATPASGVNIDVNRPSSPAFVASPPSNPVAQVSPATVASQTEPLPSRIDQIKTILAVIGIIAILFHGLRLVGSAAG